MKVNKKIEATVKKPTKQLTIEDLEAKLKKLGLDKDLFVCKKIRDPDKGWKYFIHDINWYPANQATFESYSAAATSRALTKIYKERQAATEATLPAIAEQQLRTPGLLKGQIGNAFFEPLPEDELHQWGGEDATLPATEAGIVELQTPQPTISQPLITLESVANEYGWTVIDNTLYNRAGKKVHDIKIKGDRIHLLSNGILRGTIPLSKLESLGNYLEKTFYAKKNDSSPVISH